MDTDEGDAEPMYSGGVPNPKKMGFISLRTGCTPPMPDAQDGVRAVSDKLGRPPTFIDDAGYEHEITAGTVDSFDKRIAWVESKCKQLGNFVDIEFRLKAEADGIAIIDWEVQTYNPFFGCVVGYLQWHENRLVMIDREKHRTYVVSLSIDGTKRIEQIADEWMVSEGTALFRSDAPDLVDRLTIPGLDRLEPIAASSARDAGQLPPDFEETNALNKDLRERYPREEWPVRRPLQPKKSDSLWRRLASLFGL